MSYSEDFKIFASTIYGEAASQSIASQRAIAHVIMNRIGYKEWKKFSTPVEIVTKTGFDAYTHKTSLFRKAYSEMSSGKVGTRLQLLITAVEPIFNGVEKDSTGKVVLYYSPRAQAQLHKTIPSLYAEQPKWNFSQLEKVNLLGTQVDDFAWYRYKGATAQITFSDKAKRPIQGIEYRVESKGKIISKGTTKEDGSIGEKISGEIGEEIHVFVKKADG